MGKEPKTSHQDNPLLRALSRWENEGGRTDADRETRAALAKEEEALILQCLGAAVISRWNNLPTEVQRDLFARAVSVGEPLPTADLKEQLARFLHSHKDL
ncbi:hypothetical protein IYX23_04120 [Methylocystis sp. L43]|jgi:hypothetical protein|uniref:hypothetical protein n=1 Tax=unclassified Methylocystis TaxID=2625913 RepID=UPI0018C26B48|nr:MULTISPECIES: hypothetical protein [unclassified Methylocystis]MBG0796880.1 hypothetical protein [Methylocystis sp. L43]MBG0806167.1 hypothetical protein [Methylocystis sp. H15]